jgi:hypothetical protein
MGWGMRRVYHYDKKRKKVVEMKEKPDPGPKIHIITDLTPYWDDNLGQNRVFVESKKHRKQLLRERGLDIK